MIGAIYTPDDGHVDPSGATNAMIAAAKDGGATISRRNRVTDIVQRRDGDWDVVTEKGTIHAEHVVNAAGCYAHRVAQMVGLDVPMANALHTYLITEPVPEFERRRDAGEPELPIIRDDYVSGYIRQEQTAGLIGIYEQVGAVSAWGYGDDHDGADATSAGAGVGSDGDGPNWSLENPLFDPDYERMGLWLGRAFERMPMLEELGIASAIRGAITHTPDGEAMLGPSGVPGFWMACGAQVGVADGPGLGRELALWMVHGAPNLNVRGYDARRFGFIATDDVASYGRKKGVEDYEYRHQTPLPGLEKPAERPYVTDGLQSTLAQRGAVFTQVYGWERPKWFPAVAGLPVEDQVAFRRTGWFDPVREEVRAVRERVGVLDLSAFAKFDLTGPDAAAVLDAVTTNRLPDVGRISLTYLLTPVGRIEGEMTVTRLADDHFYLVSAAVGEGKDVEHFKTYWPEGANAELRSRSRELGAIAVTGPAARDVLAAVTDMDVSNDSFKWLRAQVGTVAGVPKVRVLRVGFTGSLGWELHAELGSLGQIYGAVMEAGEAFGIADFGNHALTSLRMEKAYRVSGDLTHDVGPDDAGLGRFVRTDKGDFVGRQAVLDRRERIATGDEKQRWELAYLGVDSTVAEPLPSDAVLHDGRPVGLVTTAGYGYTVNSGLAFAYLDPASAVAGTELEVMILGQPTPARVLSEPTYDPTNKMLRS